MKNRNKYTFIVRYFAIAVFLVSLLIASNARAVDLGVSPGIVSNDQLTRGSEFNQTIQINREDAKEVLKATVEVKVPGADSWISIEGGNKFDLKSGVKTTPMVVKIVIPSSAEYKQYKGVIHITASPSVLQGNVAVASGFSVPVEITVTEKKVNSFLVKNVVAKESNEGKNIVLMMGIKNTGNIATAPTKVVLDIYDAAKKNVLISKENISDIEKVDPFTSKTVVVTFDSTGVPANNYWGKLKVYNGTEMVGDYDVGITVLPAGAKVSDAKSGTLLSDLLSGKNKVIAGVVLIVVALIVIWIIVKSVKKGKRKKSRK